MIVYLPNATSEMGVALAVALRRLIATHQFTSDGEILALTASIGLAAHTTLPGEALADLANRAKQHAKSNGKNCVAVSTDTGAVVVDEGDM